jgi:hypothetical protein
MPVSVTVTSAHASQKFTIIDSLAVQSFTFTVNETPTNVEIDNEHNILKTIIKKEGF